MIRTLLVLLAYIYVAWAVQEEEAETDPVNHNVIKWEATHGSKPTIETAYIFHSASQIMMDSGIDPKQCRKTLPSTSYYDYLATRPPVLGNPDDPGLAAYKFNYKGRDICAVTTTYPDADFDSTYIELEKRGQEGEPIQKKFPTSMMSILNIGNKAEDLDTHSASLAVFCEGTYTYYLPREPIQPWSFIFKMLAGIHDDLFIYITGMLPFE